MCSKECASGYMPLEDAAELLELGPVGDPEALLMVCNF